jgi:hypothetical protein
MTNPNRESACYPLLEALLEQKGLQLRGIYTVRDVAHIFGVSRRTIQEWCRDGKLMSRELPGRAKFLSEDLELFLQESSTTRQRSGHETNSQDQQGRRWKPIPGDPKRGRSNAT